MGLVPKRGASANPGAPEPGPRTPKTEASHLDIARDALGWLDARKMQQYSAEEKRAKATAHATIACAELLTEIRDLLAAK